MVLCDETSIVFERVYLNERGSENDVGTESVGVNTSVEEAQIKIRTTGDVLPVARALTRPSQATFQQSKSPILFIY